MNDSVRVCQLPVASFHEVLMGPIQQIVGNRSASWVAQAAELAEALLSAYLNLPPSHALDLGSRKLEPRRAKESQGFSREKGDRSALPPFSRLVYDGETASWASVRLATQSPLTQGCRGQKDGG